MRQGLYLTKRSDEEVLVDKVGDGDADGDGRNHSTKTLPRTYVPAEVCLVDRNRRKTPVPGTDVEDDSVVLGPSQHASLHEDGEDDEAQPWAGSAWLEVAKRGGATVEHAVFFSVVFPCSPFRVEEERKRKTGSR